VWVFSKKVNKNQSKTHPRAVYMVNLYRVAILRKKREFVDDAFYHVTSRTNDRIRVFENRLGRKIMLIALQDAKEKYRFCLANFCIMPTHFHLLIRPMEETSLSRIIQWIKTRSAKHWNHIHGSKDHLWGERYFARQIKDQQEYDFVNNYIDQNPVVVSLAPTPADWKASGAFYKARSILGLVDFSPLERQPYVKLISPIPSNVSKLIPPTQLTHALRYFGAYSEAIDKLYALVPTIPRLGESVFLREPPICLHYHSDTADYFVYEYDGLDTFYGLVRFSVFPAENRYLKFSLSELKSNPNIKLDFSWEVTVTPGVTLRARPIKKL
jgi:putative transposase